MESEAGLWPLAGIVAFALVFLWARRVGEDGAAHPLGTSAADDPSLADLIASGRKIEAIKRYREEHGVGLREAKEAVERLASGAGARGIG